MCARTRGHRSGGGGGGGGGGVGGQEDVSSIFRYILFQESKRLVPFASYKVIF